MPKKKNQPRHGRRRTDLATRCQMWVWYWCLQRHGPFTDDSIDQVIAHISRPVRSKRRISLASKKRRDPRLRLFSRIRRFGYVPKPRIFRGKEISLIEILDQSDHFSGSARIFNSALWELLRPPRPTLDRVLELLNQLARKRNLHRLQWEEFIVARALGLSHVLELPPGHVDDWLPMRAAAEGAKKIAKSLVVTIDIDSLTFLACLFLEAVMNARLEEGIVFREALYNAVSEFTKRHAIHDPCRTVLSYLVETRIIRGIYGREHDVEVQLESGIAIDPYYPQASSQRKLPSGLAAVFGYGLRRSDKHPIYHWISLTHDPKQFFSGYSLLNREANRRITIEEKIRQLQKDNNLTVREKKVRFSKAVSASKPNKQALKLIKNLGAPPSSYTTMKKRGGFNDQVQKEPRGAV